MLFRFEGVVREPRSPHRPARKLPAGQQVAMHYDFYDDDDDDV